MSATYNKDNKSHLFVTVFAFNPAPKINPSGQLNPDTRICTPVNFCTGIWYWLRPNLYRDTAPVPTYQNPVTRYITDNLATLYRDRASCQETLYHDGKNRAMHSLPSALEH